MREKVKRRLWLFALVWTVELRSGSMELEKNRGAGENTEKYGRWVFGVEWETPEYIIREELKWDKLKMRAAKRTCGFEERLRAGKGSG